MFFVHHSSFIIHHFAPARSCRHVHLDVAVDAKKHRELLRGWPTTAAWDWEENGSWHPTFKGDYFGGHANYPPFTRGVLLHSQPKLDKAALRMVRKYARWVYVTEADYRPNDPQAANPWNRVSKHLEQICEELSRK